MIVNRLKRCTALCLVFAAAPLLAGGSAAEPAAGAANATPDDELRELVDRRVDEWWTTPEEKRFDEIGWAADLREARQLAREHHRPIFLFTMDGRVNTGRC